MKTATNQIEMAKKDRPEYARMINAVIDNLGGEDGEIMGTIQDIVNHGIDGGFGNFIYYKDTCKFFNKHKGDILKLAETQADDFGMGMLEMIQGFGCLTDKRTNKPDYTLDEIAKAIYSGRGECVDQIQNAMAWYAGEEVCRMIEDYNTK